MYLLEKLMKISDLCQFPVQVYSNISQIKNKTRALHYICFESCGPRPGKKRYFCRTAAILIAPTVIPLCRSDSSMLRDKC